jgi:hypothetical protein
VQRRLQLGEVKLAGVLKILLIRNDVQRRVGIGDVMQAAQIGCRVGNDLLFHAGYLR